MKKAIAEFLFLRLWGWKIIGDFPAEYKKFLVVIAPHTSNWDFPLGIFTRIIKERDVKFIAKDALFKGPLNGFFRSLGGYPVDRSKNNNFVDAVVDIYNKEEAFITSITPEGTRKRVDKFKSGFYYIAKGANIPLVMVGIDHKKKELHIAEPFYVSDDYDKDVEFMLQFFRQFTPKHPEDGIFF